MIFRATFHTRGSFITLPVLLWLWTLLMGEPGAELVKLVGRFILLLGLALSFKAHWLGEGSLELELGLLLRFFFCGFFCVFFLSFPRGHKWELSSFFPPEQDLFCPQILNVWWLWMCAAHSFKKGDICPTASCFGKALIRKYPLESCSEQL